MDDAIHFQEVKLFLSSMAISSLHAKAFMNLVGKSRPEEIKIALIENAADIYPDEQKAWMYDNRDAIAAHGFQVDVVDLEAYRQGRETGLAKRLANSDVIWLGGGNTYYLRWILRETRTDAIITDLVQHGTVYDGGSAGAIVAGPTLKYFETADDPHEAPEHLVDGLGLTDTVVVPHWSNGKFGEVMEDIQTSLEQDNFKTCCITDDQALIIDGNSQRVIP